MYSTVNFFVKFFILIKFFQSKNCHENSKIKFTTLCDNGFVLH